MKYVYYLEPADEDDPEAMFFAIAEKDSWEASERLEDGSLTVEGLPSGFCEAMDSVYEYYGDWKEGRQKLLDAGFEELSRSYRLS